MPKVLVLEDFMGTEWPKSCHSDLGQRMAKYIVDKEGSIAIGMPDSHGRLARKSGFNAIGGGVIYCSLDKKTIEIKYSSRFGREPNRQATVRTLALTYPDYLVISDESSKALWQKFKLLYTILRAAVRRSVRARRRVPPTEIRQRLEVAISLLENARVEWGELPKSELPIKEKELMVLLCQAHKCGWTEHTVKEVHLRLQEMKEVAERYYAACNL